MACTSTGKIRYQRGERRLYSAGKRRASNRNVSPISHISLFWRGTVNSSRGKKRAAAAVARSLLVVCYHLLRDGNEYHGLGPNHFDHLEQSQRKAPLVKRLEKLGLRVTLEKAA